VVRPAVEERARLRKRGHKVLGSDNPADSPTGETPVLGEITMIKLVKWYRQPQQTLVRPSMMTTESWDGISKHVCAVGRTMGYLVDVLNIFGGRNRLSIVIVVLGIDVPGVKLSLC
jgi:hypothetical protein